MSGESTDIVCIGVCITDPESGICMGCGRGPEVVSWGSETAPKRSAEPLSAAQYPLPPQVAREAENPSD
jgi:predicted Fe-S protein YdhL (DUF1289 family)